MKSIASIESIQSYVAELGEALADKVREHSQPLHEPTATNQHPVLADLATPLFGKQADLVTGCVKSLDESGLAILACQMGTGKTPQGISTVHCHADRKNYRAIVICPPHLVTKWLSEIDKFLGDQVQATIIENWEQFLNLRYLPKPKCPEWYIMAMTTAKLGYSKRCAALRRVVSVFDAEKSLTFKTSALCCPRCNYPAYNRKKGLATEQEIEDSLAHCKGAWCKSCGVSHHHDRKTCPSCDRETVPCGERLWQQAVHKVSPMQYIKAKNARWFDYFIRDEAHQSKGGDSIDGHCTAKFAQLSKYVILMTGTLLAGKSEDIRPLLFRCMPRPFIDLGYGWKDELAFAQRYGRLQTIVTMKDGAKRRRSGTGSSKSTAQSVKPGIMPQLFPDFVANYTVFLSLTELATNLPSYTEETNNVPMDATMRAEYNEMKKQCLDAFQELYFKSRKYAVKLLGPMLEAFMTWPDVPYGRKPIGFTDDNDEYFCIYQPPDLDRTIIYPKEQELMEVLRREKKRGRKCWVFAVRDDTRDRLEEMLIAHGFKVASLKATVAPKNRIDWIAKNAPLCDVGLSHPELVETGLELFGPGFNFPTLIWYSTGFKLNTLRQASRRSWRIGQKHDCTTLYLYYGDSAQETAIGVMASKLVAAEAIEGKFSDGGLADESVDEDVAMTVARQMADNIKAVVQAKYRPIEAACTKEQRTAILRNKFASLRDRLKVRVAQ